MNRILRCDWLPEQARWSYLARSLGLPAVSRKKKRSHIINPFIDQDRSVKMVGYWPRFFGVFMDRDGVKAHKHAKKERGPYPAILTEQAWSITHIIVRHMVMC